MGVFPEELIELLPQILKSWQVLAAAIGVILYIKLVTYVASSYRRPRMAKKSKVKKSKAEPASGPEETANSHDSNEELGLEER